METGEIHSDPDRGGELLIQTPGMFNRYHNNPEVTAASFMTDPSGSEWFKTGDFAQISSEHHGSFKILGRFSLDIIKKQGYKISAIELECSLTESPLVNEAGVIGVPHEEYDEEIVAFVVLSQDTKMSHSEVEKELDRYMRSLHSSYKIPRIYKFIDKLPRNTMGKIDK